MLRQSRYLVISACVMMLASASSWAMAKKAADSSSQASSSSSSVQAGNSVWVVKSDGSKQCENEAGQTVESAEQDLKKAGINVLSSRKGNDGKMRAQMCGMPSGSVNAYQIPAEDLPKALSAGFQQAPGTIK